MNGESTSTLNSCKGINDDTETSRRLAHTASNELHQDVDHCTEPAAVHAANVLGKSNYGRRRSESAPDALLDCLHCGKDLSHSTDRSSSYNKPRKRHSRRYSVTCERVRSPRRFTSSLNTSCAQTFQEEERNNCQVCGSSCLGGRRRGAGCACWDSRRCDRCCGDHITCSDFLGQRRGQGNRSHSRNKPSYWRRDEKTWTRPKDIYPQSFTFDDLSTDDTVGHSGSHHTDRYRPVVTLSRKSHKYEGYRDDDVTYDDDSETELTNVNENRRRKSLTSFVRHGHGEGLKVNDRSKSKRRSHPRDSGKVPLRVDHLAQSLYDRAKSVNNHTYNNPHHLAPSRCVEKNDQRSSTSEDDDENEDEAEARETKTHPCQRDSLLIANLSDMLRRSRLCDVTLRSNGQEVSAHKLALAAFSDNFARTYCEEERGEVVIDIPDTSVGGIQEVLRFVYTGELRLTPENVGHVLATASFLHIHHVVSMCRQMLLKPDIENVISFRFLAEKYQLSEDLAYFYDYTCKHFLRVSRTRGWKTLTFAQVFDLLSEDNLDVERELDVFHAAVAWIDADRTNRLTFAADLIGCVRFAYITPDEIAKHVETRQFLFQGDEGKELLLCIYRHHALQTCGCQHGHRDHHHHHQHHHQHQHHLPRRRYVAMASGNPQDQSNSASTRSVRPPATRPFNRSLTHAPPLSDVIVAFGGVNPFHPNVDSQARLVQEFHPRHNHWATLTRLPDGRHHHGTAVVAGSIFVIGGSILDDQNPAHLCNPTASCHRYDIANKQWSATAPLNTPRMYHATAVLNDVIFVLAGQTLMSRHLCSMECYRPEVGEWETGVEMSEGRIGVAVAAHRGQLYAVGGFVETEHEHVVRSTVEIFDPKAGSWNCLNGLPSPRCHAGLAECGGTLYLVGGSTFPPHCPSVYSLSSVLRYDDADDRWDRVQTLRTPRHDMGLAVLGCRIFIVGGVSSTDNMVLSDVECYDVEGDYWLDDVEPITSPALGLTCLTVKADQ